VRGQTVLSGDSLVVGDGAAVIKLAGTARVIIRRDTQVSFQREQDGAALALLARGDLSFSSYGDSPEIRVRTGNITILPAIHLRTQGVVTIKEGALRIMASSGTVRVEGAGQPMDIAEGKVVQFQSENDTTGGSPAPSAATGPNWGKLVLCGLAGGAVGSIPVIITKETSTSEGAGAEWVAIPGGIGAGVLVCEVVPGGAPKKNPPPSCALQINGQQTDWRNPPEVGWPDKYTVSWTSENATALAMTVGPVGAPPQAVAGVAPPAGNIVVAPPGQKTGPTHMEYKMTATGPGGTATCEADVRIKKTSPPWCEFKSDPLVSYEPGASTLSWKTQRATSVTITMLKPREGFNSTPTAVPITATPSIPDGTQTVKGAPLEVGGTSGPSSANRFFLKAVGPGGTQTCYASVYVMPGCGALVDAFDFEVRTEKGVALGGAAISILGFLGGPVGGAISTATGAAANYVGQKFVSAKDACNALAACMQKQGITGEVTVQNALGNTIGKCEWKASGFGNYTP
jgi:hypothetical protein